LGTWWELIGNLKGTRWEQRKNEKMKLHTNIRHYFPLILWCLGVCSGWMDHMETGPYTCPLKTPTNAMAKDLQIHKMTAVGPMQGKSRVCKASVCAFFFSILYCSNSGKPPQTNFNLIGNILYRAIISVASNKIGEDPLSLTKTYESFFSYFASWVAFCVTTLFFMFLFST
jgi:hypothetical protein